MHRDSQHGLTIDLAGPDGNAFFLMGWAKKNDPHGHGDELIEEMAAGDYNHLIEVFEKRFTNLVTLINKPN